MATNVYSKVYKYSLLALSSVRLSLLRRHGSTDASQARQINRRSRVELAASYRAFFQLNMHEGVCNHLTALTPASDGSGKDVMLLVPYGKHWSQVTASCLLGLDLETGQVLEGDGEPELSASSIHRGIYGAGDKIDPRFRSVMHLHPKYATALGCLKNPEVRLVHQNMIRFLDHIAYDNNYDGAALALDEGKRMKKVLGDKEVVMLCNHGVLIRAANIPLAFDSIYYFERACMYQILAMQTGQELREIPRDVCEPTLKFERENDNAMLKKYADSHFDGILQKIRVEYPEFET